MNNDNNQWSTSQLVYDVDRYNDTMNKDIDNDGNPVIGPRDWKQQKLRRGFKQNRHLLGELSFLSRVNHLRITCNTKGCSKLRTKPFVQSMSITIIIFEENNMVYLHRT